MLIIIWISFAFLLGMLVRPVGLPPLVGYLLAGFVLHALDFKAGGALKPFADLGITLLLFTIGLKLQPRTLLKPHVLWVTLAHMGLMVPIATGFLLAVKALGWTLLAGLEWSTALLIGFALSFSSTVFVAKVLEEKGEVGSVYGRAAIGILIIQDIAAVVFLAFSSGQWPSPWALLLIAGLWPMRWILHRVMDRVGHGELLVLFGLTAALGGARLFELAGLKGDLGALITGLLMARHLRSDELSKSLLAFKDVFLVGFFLSIGMLGIPDPAAFAVALLLMLLIPLKALLYFGLLSTFRLRTRTSLLAALGLSNYSEFGLIVLAIAVSSLGLNAEWVTVVAVTLALSFLVAAPLNNHAYALYDRWRERLARWQHQTRIPEEELIDPGDATVMIFGMGRVGTGAYDSLLEKGGETLVGIDLDQEVVDRHCAAGRHVIRASATDPDFWDRIDVDDNSFRHVLLTMPQLEENAVAARQLLQHGFTGTITAVAKYDDDIPILREAGAQHVFNLYAEAGAGLADSLPDTVAAGGTGP